MRPEEVKVGGFDIANVRINQIYYKTDAYCIYLTDFGVKYMADERKLRLTPEHLALREYTYRTLSLVDRKIRRYSSICAMLALSLALNFEGNNNGAIQVARSAENHCILLKTLIGRIVYTISAFILVSLLFSVCLLSHWFNTDQILRSAMNACFFGGLGAAMSVALGYKNIEIDVDAGEMVNILMGVSRVFIGISASIFCFLAINADFAFSFVKNHSPWGMWMIAMVSGFLEKLAPSIMTSLSDKHAAVSLHHDRSANENTPPHSQGHDN